MNPFRISPNLQVIQTANLAKTPNYATDPLLHRDMVMSAKYSNLINAISYITLDGFFLEFGVFQGNSINFIAGKIGDNQLIYGFDCWQGIHEDWLISQSLCDPSTSVLFKKGTWSTNNVLPKVKTNVRLISGMFEDSLPEFCKIHFSEHAPNFTSFVHIDSDLYSSAKTIFKYIGHTFITGSVIVFDEFHAVGHEDKAFKEWLLESNHTATLVSKTTSGQCVFIID